MHTRACEPNANTRARIKCSNEEELGSENAEQEDQNDQETRTAKRALRGVHSCLSCDADSRSSMSGWVRSTGVSTIPGADRLLPAGAAAADGSIPAAAGGESGAR